MWAVTSRENDLWHEEKVLYDVNNWQLEQKQLFIQFDSWHLLWAFLLNV